MEAQAINKNGDRLLKKTYDENCQVKSEWKKIHSLKLKSLYLPHFINTYEIIATDNELMFDDYLNNINLYLHPEIMVYVAIYGKQIIYHNIIYHNSHYMIINRSPTWNSSEWRQIG